MDKSLSFFTFRSSKLEGRGPGLRLGTVLFCRGELAADAGELLFRAFSGVFPLLPCLSFSGLQVRRKRGTITSMLNALCFQASSCDSEATVYQTDEQFFFKCIFHKTLLLNILSKTTHTRKQSSMLIFCVPFSTNLCFIVFITVTVPPKDTMDRRTSSYRGTIS